jgi:hypothetical protein
MAVTARVDLKRADGRWTRGVPCRFDVDGDRVMDVDLELSIDDADTLAGETLAMHVPDRGVVSVIVATVRTKQQRDERSNWTARRGWYGVRVVGGGQLRSAPIDAGR